MRSLTWLVAFALLFGAACADLTGPGVDGEPGACGKCDEYGDEELEAASLTALGAQQVVLPNGASEQLSVRYENHDEDIDAGEVSFYLRGEGQGAYLDAETVSTDADGVATVVVTAASSGRTGFEVVAEARSAASTSFQIAVTGGALPDDSTPDPSVDLERHSPVLIDGDSGFTAANGVSNPDAEGTESDPFVIEGLHIEPGHESPCFELRGTTLHVVIRQSHCSYAAMGVVLQNVDNATISDTVISGLSGVAGAYPSGDGGPAVAIAMQNVTNVAIEGQTLVASISGGPGAMGDLGFYSGGDGGDGGDVFGLLVSGSNDDVRITGLTLRQMSGGSGGAGAMGSTMGADGGSGGDGGDCWPIYVEGNSEGLTLSGLELAYLYGGAGAAGAVGVMGAGWIYGGDGGSGGNGGSTHAVYFDGDHDALGLRETTFSSVYGGAGGAGAVGAMSAGDAGNGGAGGHSTAIGLSGRFEDVVLSDNSFEYIYGGAGAVGGVGAVDAGDSGDPGAGGNARGIASTDGSIWSLTALRNSFDFVYGGAGAVGSMGPVNGSDGTGGGDGGSSVAIDLVAVSDGTISEGHFRWIYGAAGGAGAVGAWSWLTGGHGGDGGHGAFAFAIRLERGSAVTIRGNEAAFVYGGAGAVGGWGGTGSFGGDGGEGGSGGDAAGVRLERVAEATVTGNDLSYIFGAAGGMGAMGGFGAELVSGGGDGGDGGDGAGLHAIGCSALSHEDNAVASVFAGIGALGGLSDGRLGSGGERGEALITQ